MRAFSYRKAGTWDGVIVKALIVFGLFLSCLVGAVASPEADSLVFRKIGTSLGLPSDSVKDFAQDERGVIWLATEWRGLVSCDGSEFISYRADPMRSDSISNDLVNAVMVDSKGRVWAATFSGLDVLNGTNGSFSHYTKYGEADAKQIVYAIAEDEEGYIWFGGEGGVGRLDAETGEITTFEIPFSRWQSEGGTCHSLFVDGEGTVWMGTQYGLFYLSPKARELEIKGSRYNRMTDGLVDAQVVFDIAQDGTGRLWLATQAGASWYDPMSGRSEQLSLSVRKERESQIAAGSILVDDRGWVWVSTIYNGLRIFDLDTGEMRSHMQSLLRPDGLASDELRGLFKDRNGLVWVGTRGKGIQLYDDKGVTFPHFAGLVVSEDTPIRGSVHVKSVFEDKTGILWIGTLLDGILGYDPESGDYTRLREAGTEADAITALGAKVGLESVDGELWFGVPEGLLVFDADKSDSRRYACPSVKSLLELSLEQLLVGTQSGLLFFDRDAGRFETFAEETGLDRAPLRTSEITLLYQDDNDQIWVGTKSDGLYRYDGEKGELVHFSSGMDGSRNSLRSGNIRALLEDVKGRIWLGMKGGGVMLYAPELDSFRPVEALAAFDSEYIYSILEDLEGNLWICSENGLIKYSEAADTVDVFTTEYGLAENRLDELNAVLRTRGGRFFIGSRYGFNYFDPLKVVERDLLADALITSLKVMNKDRMLIVDPDLEIELDYKSNYLTFSFALTDYSVPMQNEFAYRLLGFDDDWVYSGTRNYATYTALPAGDYRLQMRARAPGGEWVENEFDLPFVVTPPFWLTKLFLVSASVLLLGICLSVYGYTLGKAKRQKARLERLVDERTAMLKVANELLEESRSNLEEKVYGRTRELSDARQEAERALKEARKADELKSAFLANLSHEIRTPMNAIIGFSSMLRDLELEEEERKQFVRLIESNGNDLMNLVNDLLDLSMIEAGQMSVTSEKVQLPQMMANLYRSYEVMLKNSDKSPQVELILTEEPKIEYPILSDGIRLKQILANFLNNAVKFTDHGSIEFGYRLIEGNKRIHFFVKDTGIGIKGESHDAIFERFHKLESESSRLFRGSGLGLSICRELAELLDSEIGVESNENEGSVFYLNHPLRLPLGSGGSKRSCELKASSELGVPYLNGAKEANRGVLIVAEDEDSNFALLQAMLRNERLELVRAVDGVEVVEECRRHPEAVAILMDIKMPRRSGIEAAREIRRFNTDIPIIANTAYAMPSDKEEILASSFDGYLSKPLSRSRLIECLSGYLQEIKD